MRLCIRLAADQELAPDLQIVLGDYIAENIYRIPRPGQPAAGWDSRIVPRCMAALLEIRTWLQKLSDRATALSVLQENQLPEVKEMFEFSRTSLIQQHECIAVIMGSAVDKRHTDEQDFKNMLALLQKWDRYDVLLGM